jgi:hypothetical protein
MPPADHPKQLTASEKKVLADWIRTGAEWKDHWAYVSPVRHSAPETNDKVWPSGEIDLFVLAQLERDGFRPSKEAERRILLRRLTFDLTGLPPKPEHVRAFLAESSDNAWENQVDRLLMSTHYGERMAMYWLDLVRYADSVGYHGDQLVSVSPFRDYVINAFNSNMPFDCFTREQLSGDLLPEPTRDQLIASGYNKLGMMSAEGGVQPKEYLAKYASDRVRTASAVWMGSTLGCAECHDHKFDPFTTKDFYRFAAFFADIKERGLYSGANRTGDWGPRVDVPDDDLPEIVRPVETLIADLQKQLDTPTGELAAELLAWENDTVGRNTEWHIVMSKSTTALHKTKLTVQEDQSILASGANPDQNTYTITAKSPVPRVTGFRVEVLPDKSLPQNGPGRAGNGNFVISEFRVRLTSDKPAAVKNISLQNATATIEQKLAGNVTPYGVWNAASAIDNDVKGSSWGWAILPDVGNSQSMVVEAVNAVDIAKDTLLTFVIEQNHTNGKHTVGRFRLFVTSSPHPLHARGGTAIPSDIHQILAVEGGSRSAKQSTTLATWFRTIAPSLAKVRAKLNAAKKKKEQLVKNHTRTSLITVAVAPREIRVLPRGNWMDESGEVVEPGVPHFLRQIRNNERSSRFDLAEWITARDNPLTARVFVNRLWKLYFGTGLSKVLDDMGAQGEAPVYPELLDNLAVEFVESGWDVKHMIKLIVMSRTYRQSSLPRHELADVDPYNRLLARQSRFRLDAELVRDNALAVSGLLVRHIGGRSVHPYQPAGLYRHLNFPRRTYRQDTGDDQYRRGLYTHWQRQFLHPAMKAFDAPSREECTAERPRSNTPLGALVLLNDPSYVEAARAFAVQAIQDGGETDQTRTDWIMRRALSRNVTTQEAAIVATLLKSQREKYRLAPDAAQQLISTGLSAVPSDVDTVEQAAWTSIARAVFNMHEFMTRN